MPNSEDSDLSIDVTFVLRTPQATTALRTMEQSLRTPTSRIMRTFSVQPDSFAIDMTCAPGLVSFGTACTNCPVGRLYQHSAVYADRDCVACAAGKHRIEPLDLTCSVCEPGSQPNAAIAASDCDVCVSGTFSPDGNYCTDCPDMHRSTSDGTGCLCESGTFNVSMLDDVQCISSTGVFGSGERAGMCQQCPSLSSCVACDGEYPAAQPGYWGAKDSHLYQCERSESCLGGRGTPCKASDGYMGVACAACMDGWIMVKGECERCSQTAVRFLLSFVSVVCIVAWAVRSAEPRMRQTESYTATLMWERQKIYSRTLISFLQLQAIVSHFEVEWPVPELGWILTLESLFAGPSGPLELSQCMLRGENSFELDRPFLLIWLVPVLTALGTWLGRKCQRRRQRRRALKEGKYLADESSGLPDKITGQEKLRAIFERYDDSGDGVLQRAELDRMAMELEGSDYDEAAWNDLCEAVGVNPEVGLEIEHLDAQFRMSGSSKALDDAFAQLFPGRSLGSAAAATSTAPDAWSVASVLMFFAHPAMLHQFIATLSCRSLDAQLSVLTQDPGVVCSSPEQLQAVKVASAGFIIFGLGLPAAYVALCRRGWEEKALKPLAFGWRYPEWECVVTLRKLFMAAIAVMCRAYGGVWQAVFGLVVVQVAIVLHWHVQPSLSSTGGRLETLGLMVTWTTLFAILIIGLTGEQEQTLSNESFHHFAGVAVGLLCVAANLVMLLWSLWITFQKVDYAPGDGCCKVKHEAVKAIGGGAPVRATATAKIAPLALQSLVGVAHQQHAPPALKVLSMLQEQVAAASRMPELHSELSNVAMTLERIGVLAKQHRRTAESLHARSAATLQISLEDNRVLLPKSARRYLDTEPPPEVANAAIAANDEAAVKKQAVKEAAMKPKTPPIPLRRPAWYAGVNHRARSDALRQIYPEFTPPRTNDDIITVKSLHAVLSSLGHGPFVKEEIQAVVHALNGKKPEQAYDENETLSVEGLIKTVESMADRTVSRRPSMVVVTKGGEGAGNEQDEDEDVAEPDWSSRFVVGKLLAKTVEEHPMVVGGRAGQRALDSAKKRGYIDQLLSSSPFWSMKPNELRHLLRGMGGPHAAAADEKMLKSQLIRYVVESEVYHEAKSKAVLECISTAEDGTHKDMTVAEKATAAAEASRGSARALAGTARAEAARERRLRQAQGRITRTSGSQLSLISSTSSLEEIEEETPRAVGHGFDFKGSSKLARQAFGMDGEEAAAAARASTVYQGDSGRLKLVKKAASRVPIPPALEALQNEALGERRNGDSPVK